MAPRGQGGRYKGVNWIRRRIDDVLCVDVGGWERWYFLDPSEGDHFKTQRELFEFIDDQNKEREL